MEKKHAPIYIIKINRIDETSYLPQYEYDKKIKCCVVMGIDNGFIEDSAKSSHTKNSKSSRFSKNVLTLFGGTTAAQLITILASPIVTRLYSPEAFGVFSIFISITGILAVIACLRYELAIMLPESDKEAANVFGLCILISTSLSILSIPTLILSQQIIIQYIQNPLLVNFFWLFPIAIFLNGIFSALNYWNSRTKSFYRLSIAQIFKSSSSTGIQIGFGSVGYATAGVLISANIIALLVSTLVLGIQVLKEYMLFFKQNIQWDGIVNALKQYIRFPKYDIWSALLNTISTMLPIFILTAYFNPAIVGYYALGYMVLHLPVTLIGSSISQVFFQKAAEIKNINKEQLRDTVEKTVKPLIFLIFFPILLLMLIGPELFSVVFGVKWEEAGVYARYLSLWIGIVFISQPITTLFSIFQKQQFSLIFNIFQIISRIIALLIGAIMGNALIAIILFALVGFISNLIAYRYLLGLVDISIRIPANIAFHYLLLSVPSIILIILFQFFLSNIFLIVILSLIVSIIFYIVVLKKDPELFNSLKNITSQIPGINRYL